MKLLYIIILCMLPMAVSAQSDTATAKKPSFFKKVGVAVNNFIEEFNDYDTTYIEPNHYNYCAMLQGTQSMERYRLKTKDDKSVVMGPDLNPRIGPYFGWRWLFLGYTFDIKNISFSSDGTRRDFDVSLYTALFGIDVFSKKTGSHYKIKSINLGKGVDVDDIEGTMFNGINVSMTGFNLYYIFNHKKFSYPAAYNQSTQQKKSAGSLIAGIGYTKHSLDYDHKTMDTLLTRFNVSNNVLDSTMRVKSVKYRDLNFSVGYSYNWVFAKNFLFNASLSAALAIDRATSEYDTTTRKKWYEKMFFSINDVNIDGIGRFGLLYNNGKWFAGSSFIVHTYTYRGEGFSTMNMFSDLNIYVGFNFLRRKK